MCLARNVTTKLFCRETRLAQDHWVKQTKVSGFFSTIASFPLCAQWSFNYHLGPRSDVAEPTLKQNATFLWKDGSTPLAIRQTLRRTRILLGGARSLRLGRTWLKLTGNERNSCPWWKRLMHSWQRKGPFSTLGTLCCLRPINTTR